MLGLSSPVVAQWGSEFSNPRRVLLTPEQVEVFVERLGLDDDQRAIAEVLIADYLAAHQERVRELNATRAEVDGPSASDLSEEEQRLQAIEQWRERLRVADAEYKAREQLKADLQLLVREEQLPEWERFWRDHRRWTLLPSAHRFMEATIDLVALWESLEERLPRSREADELLEQYAAEVDADIREYGARRHESIRDHFEKQIARLEGTWRDPLQEAFFSDEARSLSYEELIALNERILALANERRINELAPAREAGRRIRDCNRKYLDLLATLLTPEGGRVLRRAFLVNAYDQYFDLPERGYRFHSHYFLERALALPDVADDVRARIEDIQSNYVRRFDEIAFEIIRVLHEAEENWKTMIREETPYGPGPTATRLEARIDEHIERRRELQETTIATVRALLTPEQQAQIPSEDERERTVW